MVDGNDNPVAQETRAAGQNSATGGQGAATQQQQPKITGDSDPYDPLARDNPKGRAYSRNVNPNDISDIPEPTFSTNTGPSEVPDFEREAQKNMGGGVGGPQPGSGAGPSSGADNRFSDMRDLPPGKKKKSAQAFAKLLVDGYAKYVPMLFRYLSKYPEDKLLELSAKGKVDFSIEFVFPDQTTKNVYQFIQMVNNQIEIAFEVTEEWKQEILPYVVEELRTRGWGTTPMQTIMWMVVEDLGMKTVAAMVISRQIGSFVEFAIQETRNRGGGPRTASPPPQQEAPPDPPQPDAGPVPDDNVVASDVMPEGEEKIEEPEVEVIPASAVAE